MSKFIELTDSDYNNTKFLVNVDTIRDIYPMDTGCAIMFAHRGMTTHVAESYETVKAMMDDNTSVVTPENVKNFTIPVEWFIEAFDACYETGCEDCPYEDKGGLHCGAHFIFDYINKRLKNGSNDM